MSMPVVKAKIVSPEVFEVPEKKKRIWDNYQVVGEVQKSSKIKFVVGAGIRDGVRYINIREFYMRQRDGEWRPGRDGITIPLMIPVDHASRRINPYNDLLPLLAETAEVLKGMELYNENNAVYIAQKEKKNA